MKGKRLFVAGYSIASLPPPPRPSAPAQARQQLYANGKFTEITGLPGKCLPKDEIGNFIASQERSDVVHDLLAFLAEKMLEMNRQKQTEIKGFLGWLEGYLGAKVEELTPKTKLQSYYEHNYEGFLAVLKRNSKKPDPRAEFKFMCLFRVFLVSNCAPFLHLIYDMFINIRNKVAQGILFIYFRSVILRRHCHIFYLFIR
ncbi:MAG: hypothetical protein WCW68_14545 [Methanothrix sp.]